MRVYPFLARSRHGCAFQPCLDTKSRLNLSPQPQTCLLRGAAIPRTGSSIEILKAQLLKMPPLWDPVLNKQLPTFGGLTQLPSDLEDLHDQGSVKYYIYIYSLFSVHIAPICEVPCFYLECVLVF